MLRAPDLAHHVRRPVAAERIDVVGHRAQRDVHGTGHMPADVLVGLADVDDARTWPAAAVASSSTLISWIDMTGTLSAAITATADRRAH